MLDRFARFTLNETRYHNFDNGKIQWKSTMEESTNEYGLRFWR